MLSSAPCRKAAEHHNVLQKKNTAGAWVGLVAMAGPSQSCVHGAGSKEAACPAAGSRASAALTSKPLPEICVCLGWKHPARNWVKSKQLPACFLPAPASNTGQRYCCGGAKNTLEKPSPLPKRARGMVAHNGCKPCVPPSAMPANLHNAPIPQQQVSVSQAVNIPCSQPDRGVCL